MEEQQFHLQAPFQPTGDQPQAIEALVQGIEEGDSAQTLLGEHHRTVQPPYIDSGAQQNAGKPDLYRDAQLFPG